MNVLRRAADDSVFVFSGFLLGLAGFVVSVAGVSAGLGLLVVWLGLPVLAGTVLAARGLAHIQRDQLRRRHGLQAPTPVYLDAQGGVMRRILTPLRDPQSWLDLAWAFVAFVTGLVAFVVSVSWAAVALGGLTYWLWEGALPSDDEGLMDLLGWGWSDSVVNLVLGVVALVTLPWVLRLCAGIHAGVADVLLCSRAGLQTQVQRVTDSREAARGAEAQALRRLERDLHDGPQQGMVRLALDISRARKHLESDPARAGEILDDALLRARGTTEELRALSRGIAPPLLVDRGLPAAVQELLQRSPLETTLSIELPAALPPHVETALYFVVSEALTNVAKHSGASRVDVTLGALDGVVAARVDDDGVGGAHVSKGSGLAGLEQRLAGVEGTLTVISPVGGPTSLVAAVPMA